MSQQESADQQDRTGQEEQTVTDPEDTFIQALIALGLVACLTTIALVSLELNSEYGVTFGGILSPPDQVSEPAE